MPFAQTGRSHPWSPGHGTNWRDVAVKVGWTLLQVVTAGALTYAAGWPPAVAALITPALTALSAIARQRAYVPPEATDVQAVRSGQRVMN
jgi:hypothetical protein